MQNTTLEYAYLQFQGFDGPPFKYYVLIYKI